MAEYIACRRCDSPDCKGCNLKRLETMLENGKFDCLMNENRSINTSYDVETVRHGRWKASGGLLECQNCGEIYSTLCGNEGKAWDYCPDCGARMDGDDDAEAD